MQLKTFKLLLLVVSLLLLAGCAQQEKTTPQVTTAPTSTPTLTSTLTPTHSTHTTTRSTFEFRVKYNATVLKIVDGDTIDVVIDRNIYRIRLLGVDCPETTVEHNKPYEYDSITNLTYLTEWGLKAKEFAEAVLDHKIVYVEFDELAGLKGYYGRYLAYIYLENGSDFNAMLLKNGLARVYTEGTFKKESEYIQYENFAKTNKIGLWNYSSTTTPTTITTMSSSIRIDYINYDAPGNDRNNPNGEYVVIKNYGSNSVNMKDWKLKDRAGHTYTFPSITLKPGDTVYIYSGTGADHDHVLY